MGFATHSSSYLRRQLKLTRLSKQSYTKTSLIRIKILVRVIINKLQNIGLPQLCDAVILRESRCCQLFQCLSPSSPSSSSSQSLMTSLSVNYSTSAAVVLHSIQWTPWHQQQLNETALRCSSLVAKHSGSTRFFLLKIRGPDAVSGCIQKKLKSVPNCRLTNANLQSTVHRYIETINSGY